MDLTVSFIIATKNGRYEFYYSQLPGRTARSHFSCFLLALLLTWNIFSVTLTDSEYVFHLLLSSLRGQVFLYSGKFERIF